MKHTAVKYLEHIWEAGSKVLKCPETQRVCIAVSCEMWWRYLDSSAIRNII